MSGLFLLASLTHSLLGKGSEHPLVVAVSAASLDRVGMAPSSLDVTNDHLKLRGVLLGVLVRQISRVLQVPKSVPAGAVGAQGIGNFWLLGNALGPVEPLDGSDHCEVFVEQEAVIGGESCDHAAVGVHMKVVVEQAVLDLVVELDLHKFIIVGSVEISKGISLRDLRDERLGNNIDPLWFVHDDSPEVSEAFSSSEVVASLPVEAHGQSLTLHCNPLLVDALFIKSLSNFVAILFKMGEPSVDLATSGAEFAI